jgi:hypothetical protein
MGATSLRLSLKIASLNACRRDVPELLSRPVPGRWLMSNIRFWKKGELKHNKFG